MNRTRIDTVLRIRGLQERRARSEVGRTRQELSVRENDERRVRALVNDRAEKSPARLSAAAFIDSRMVLTSGMAHAENRRVHVVVARDDVDNAMVAWRREAERLDGIERLAARFADLAREEEARSAAAEIDDLVIARWPTTNRADQDPQLNRSDVKGGAR